MSASDARWLLFALVIASLLNSIGSVAFAASQRRINRTLHERILKLEGEGK